MADVEHAEGQTGTLETRADAGEGSEGKLKFYLLELHAADKLEHDYREDGENIEDRYEAEEARIANAENRVDVGLVSHNILYSNVETMRPALYDSTPKPDIRRRFRDKDPNGKQVSELLERATIHQLEINDIDGIMDDVILDSLLPSRGLCRLNYEPTFNTIPEQRIPFDPAVFNADTGQPDQLPQGAEMDEQGNVVIVQPQREVITDERVNVIYVSWRHFRISPARTWEDVRWVCFDWFLTKEQSQKMFPGKDIPLDVQTKESFHEDQEVDKVPSVFKRAYVREIWDKKTRKVIFIAPSFKEGVLREDDDPLHLEQFFPMPKPLYGIRSRKSMVPVPEFKQYVSQALELDMITKRIQGLIRALKYRGFYDSTLAELGDFDSLSENEFKAVTNANQWRDAGGLEKAFFTMPIEEAAKVLRQLYGQRDQIKDTIFEITGLADILRGVSDPNETLGAQEIKSQFGSLRISRKQREVQRFTRDIIRLMVEIIAEHFQPETLQKITQKQVTPEMMEIMKSDQLRSYRVDIETDSTIARQIQDEEENYTKLINSIGQFVQMVAPMVVTGLFPIEVAITLLQSGIRRFKMGRSVEDAFEDIDIDKAKQQIAQQQEAGQKNPEAEAKQQEMQLKVEEVKQKLQLEAQKLQLSQGEQQSKTQTEAAKIKLDRDKTVADMQLEQQKITVDGQKVKLDRDKATAELSFEAKKLNAELKLKKELELAKIAATLINNNGEEVSSDNMEEIRQLADAIKQLMQNMNAPKVLVRDGNNRIVGVENKQIN